MRTRTFCLVTLLAVVPMAAQAQDSTSTARVEATMSAAAEAGIPVSLLERKVAEGRAKGVPMARIASAVEARLEALTSARDALAEAGMTSTTEGELSVAADAIQAGVSGAALATVSSSAPPERRAVAIAVLSELVAHGRSSAEALVQVREALAAGPEALANLRAGSGAGAGVGAGAGGAGVQVDATAGAGARIDLGGRGN